MIKALAPVSAEDKALCPVRALRYYLKATSGFRRGRKPLFLAYKTGFRGEVHKNTISAWLKKTISMAYATAEERDLRGSIFQSSRAHEVRALAASWARYNNVCASAILEACTWKSFGVFADFYLRDLSVQAEELYALGPISVAQATVGGVARP